MNKITTTQTSTTLVIAVLLASGVIALATRPHADSTSAAKPVFQVEPYNPVTGQQAPWDRNYLRTLHK